MLTKTLLGSTKRTMVRMVDPARVGRCGRRVTIGMANEHEEWYMEGDESGSATDDQK